MRHLSKVTAEALRPLRRIRRFRNLTAGQSSARHVRRPAMPKLSCVRPISLAQFETSSQLTEGWQKCQLAYDRQNIRWWSDLFRQRRSWDIVNSAAVSSIILAVVFGGAIAGMLLRTVLPYHHHLRDDSRDCNKDGDRSGRDDGRASPRSVGSPRKQLDSTVADSCHLPAGSAT